MTLPDYAAMAALAASLDEAACYLLMVLDKSRGVINTEDVIIVPFAYLYGMNGHREGLAVFSAANEGVAMTIYLDASMDRVTRAFLGETMGHVLALLQPKEA